MSSAYRKISIPIKWTEEKEEKQKLSDEVASNLKKAIIEFCGSDEEIDPRKIQKGLKSMNFHKENPEIYKAIEELCMDCEINGTTVTPDQFVKYLGEKIGNINTRSGVNVLFNSIANKEQNEITSDELKEIINELGDSNKGGIKFTEDDVKYIMEVIADPSKNPNINLDDFYYIMTKKPADVVKIAQITKSQM